MEKIEKYFYVQEIDFFYDKDKFSFDENGIIKTIYKKDNVQYNPVHICQFALANLNEFVDNGNEKYLKQFILQSDYLIKNNDKINDNLIAYPYKFSYEIYNLQANWYSGMAQGLVISVLIRRYYIEKNENLLEIIKMIKNFMILPIDKGGLARNTPEGNLWIEEYPTEKPSLVLNGFIFSLVSLYECSNLFEDCIKLYNKYLASLKDSLKYYDTDSWTIYDRYYNNKADDGYMDVHIKQIKYLYQLTKESIFQQYGDKWNLYKNEKLKLKIRKIEEIQNILNCINGDIIIYGGGVHTQNLFNKFDLKNVLCIVDKNNFGYINNGYIVEHPNKLNKLKGKTIIISSYSFQEEIFDFLLNEIKYNGTILKLYNKEVDEDVFY